jgi:hypothetical protein
MMVLLRLRIGALHITDVAFVAAVMVRPPNSERN